MVNGCMVYTERAETAVVLCGTTHASAVTPAMPPTSVDMKNTTTKNKKCYKKLVTHAESHAIAVSLLESGE